jgi:hypothetical protein
MKPGLLSSGPRPSCLLAETQRQAQAGLTSAHQKKSFFTIQSTKSQQHSEFKYFKSQ